MSIIKKLEIIKKQTDYKNQVEIIQNQEISNQQINFNKHLFMLYMRLNMNSNNEIPEKMNKNSVYKILESKILESKTRIIVKDVGNGKIYYECNSAWFLPMNTFFARMSVKNNTIAIGSSAILWRRQNLNSITEEQAKISEIRAIEMISDDIVVLVTENSLYITQLI